MLRPARSLSLCSALVILLAACGEGEPLLPADARLPDGARYRGELVDGRLEGQGRLDYDNGAWYAGRFEHGLLPSAIARRPWPSNRPAAKPPL